MNLILIGLLTICLSSCRGVNIVLPVIQNHERCASFIEEIEPGIYSGKCRCQEYQISKQYIGRVGESYDQPLTYCSKRVSFSAQTWSDQYLYFFDELFFMHSKNNQKARTNQYEREIEDLDEAFK